MRNNAVHLGSLGVVVLQVLNVSAPLLQLAFDASCCQNASQATLAEGVNCQSCWRLEQVILNLRRQVQQVHDLCHSRPRKPLFFRDFCSGQASVSLELLRPTDRHFVRMDVTEQHLLNLFYRAGALGGHVRRKQHRTNEEWLGAPPRPRDGEGRAQVPRNSGFGTARGANFLQTVRSAFCIISPELQKAAFFQVCSLFLQSRMDFTLLARRFRETSHPGMNASSNFSTLKALRAIPLLLHSGGVSLFPLIALAFSHSIHPHDPGLPFPAATNTLPFCNM